MYHADVQDFLRETGYLPKNIEPVAAGQTRNVPLVEWVRVGQWHETSDAFEVGDADEWIESDVKGAHVFALRVKGDSMEPEFNEGEIIARSMMKNP